ncbi:MAG: MFS transporter [Chloroflexi bacterium]|nr:MFS transporter [Chloroflexota bacterium]MCY3937570.1 MFS transporter [Chloroflexota bacterium]
MAPLPFRICRSDHHRKSNIAPNRAEQRDGSEIATEIARDYVRTVFLDRRFGLFLLLLFINGVVFGPFLPFLPVYVEEELELSQTFTANFRTISLFLMATFVLLGGVLSDSLGPKKSMMLGLIGTPVAAAVFIIVNPGVLLALSIYRGISDGLLNGGGQTYMIATAPASRLGAATAIYFLGNTLGSALGSLIGGVILELSSFTILGFAMLATSGPVLLAVLFLLPDVQTGASGRPKVTEVLRGYREIVGRRHVWTLSSMQFLRTTFWGAASLTMPFLMNELTGSKIAVSAFNTVSLVVGMASMIVVGAISDRIGRRKIVMGCIAGIGISSALLALSSGNAPGLFVAGTLATTIAWTLSGQVTPLAKEMSEQGEEGRLVGMILFPWALGMLAGAQIHGQFSESNPGLMFALLTILLVASLGLAELMFRSAAARPAFARRD